MRPDKAIDFLFQLGIEGKTSMDPEDNGNWTGGAKGQGELLGTHWGIAASSGLPIPKTPEEARELYRIHYWLNYRCGELPHPLDFLYFDACVNQTGSAARNLQSALGVLPDGVVGAKTLAAANASKDILAVAAEFCALRGYAYGKSVQFERYGLGWQRRLQRATFWALTA